MRDRRSVLRLLGILAGGALTWGAVETINRTSASAGSRRRFTGSRLASDTPDGPFPVTNWMFDPIPALDPTTYTLTIGGAVRQPYTLTLDGVHGWSPSTLRATLDCTGGWYTEQEWQGIRVGELLAQAAPDAAARYVRFRASTGYRWSLPIAEAADTLLATHVGGSALIQGHGAPLRLVASGRRGFQWVKWVVAVELLTAPDVGQWGVIFTSGVD